MARSHACEQEYDLQARAVTVLDMSARLIECLAAEPDRLDLIRELALHGIHVEELRAALAGYQAASQVTGASLALAVERGRELEREAIAQASRRPSRPRPDHLSAVRA